MLLFQAWRDDDVAHPQERIQNPAGSFDVRQGFFDDIYRERETHVLSALSHGRIDSDGAPAQIKQGAAGIPRINGGIGLNHLLKPFGARSRAGGQHRAPKSGDDSDRDRVLEFPQSVSDGDHGLPHLKIVGIAEGNECKIISFRSENRDILHGIARQNFCRKFPTVIHDNRILGFPVLHHMAVCRQHPVRGQEKTGAGGDLPFFRAFLPELRN